MTSERGPADLRARSNAARRECAPVIRIVPFPENLTDPATEIAERK